MISTQVTSDHDFAGYYAYFILVKYLLLLFLFLSFFGCNISSVFFKSITKQKLHAFLGGMEEY